MKLLLALLFAGKAATAHGVPLLHRSLQDRITRHHHNYRQLQDDAADVCSSLDTVFAEDFLYETNVYQPVCQCNPVNSVFDVVTGDTLLDMADRIEAINTEVLANGWLVVDTTTCDNTCTVCLQGEAGLCGRMTLTDRSELQLELQNDSGFTAEDFLGETGTDGLLDDFHIVRSLITGESCFEGDEGTLCYAVHFGYEDTVGVPFAQFVGGDNKYCTVSLDGTECNSCTFDVEQECLAADCTNLHPGAVWGCQPTLEDLEGPFLPILLITQPGYAPRNFSVGSCEVDENNSVVGTPAVASPTDTTITPETTVLSPPAPVDTIWTITTPTDAPIAPNEAPVIALTIPTDAPPTATADMTAPEAAANTSSPTTVPKAGGIVADATSSARQCSRALLISGAIQFACMLLYL